MSKEQGAPAAEKHDIALQLEQELQRTKDQLQATIELSDASTEELKASNEELQAINEELETNTEELQSVNEELLRVNAELKSKVDEAERAYDDLKNFIAATDVATIFVDANMAIKRYTPRVELLFNVISSDIGRPLTDITHRLDFPTLAADTASAIDTQRVVEREVQSADGRWWIARVSPYQSTHHGASGAVLTFVDITGLRLAEESAEQGGSDIRQALQQSKDFAVIVTNPQGTITGWNEGATRVFGYRAEEVEGRSLDLIFTPADIAAGRPEEEMTKARTTGRAEDDRWHLGKGGTRVFCSGVMTPLTVGDHPGFVKIVRDVTEQHREIELGQRKLKRARARRADAEAAVALKDEFLAVMSHELKHPLNLINVNAEIIARTPDLGIDRSRVASNALRTISRAVRTQTKIIDDLLDLSRMRTGKLTLERTAVDLAALVELSAETAAAGSAAAEIQVNFVAREPHVLVYADAARLNQIVWNLLSNAIKFTPAGGRIDVEVDVDDGFGRVEVTDSGVGIEAAYLPRIFEMFGQARARANSTQSGLGIGLALVRQLAEHHGGRVEGDSPGPGLGARFTVWIPLYVEAPSAEKEKQEVGTRSHCADLKLLIVDDDPATVEALGTLLELEGATVLRAESVAEALAHLKNGVPDLVVTDLGMPGYDGYALLQALRSHSASARVPVIALTGFGRPDDIKRAIDAGFDRHLGKPVDFPRLLQLIAELGATGP